MLNFAMGHNFLSGLGVLDGSRAGVNLSHFSRGLGPGCAQGTACNMRNLGWWTVSLPGQGLGAGGSVRSIPEPQNILGFWDSGIWGSGILGFGVLGFCDSGVLGHGF